MVKRLKPRAIDTPVIRLSQQFLPNYLPHMSKFQHHVFVCTQARQGDQRSCTAQKSIQLADTLQAFVLVNPDLAGRVAVTECACLGPCLDGPNVVIYPAGIWYAGVTPEDAREIVESHLVGSVPVERLRYHWPDD